MESLAKDFTKAVEAMTLMSQAATKAAADATAAQNETITKLIEKMDADKAEAAAATAKWKMQEKSEKDEKKVDVTVQKSFSDLPKLSGKPEEFDSWRFKMYQYLTKDENYTNLLEWIEKQQDDIDDENIESFDLMMTTEKATKMDMKWYNTQLWSILTLNCTGEALGRIKNLEGKTTTRGFSAWLRVTKDFRGMSAQRLIGLVERIYSPIRAKKTADVPLAIEAWEMSLGEYERHTEQSVPPIAKMWAFRKIVTEEMEKDLKRLCTSLKEYKDCKRYVEEQVAMSRPAHFADAGDRDKKTKKESETIDALFAELHKLKGEKQEEDEPWSEGVDQKTTDELEAQLFALRDGSEGGGKGWGKDGGGKSNA